MNVEKNAIKDIKINGDFFGLGEISDVEKALVGVGYNREDLTKAFEAIDIRRYFGNVTAVSYTHLDVYKRQMYTVSDVQAVLVKKECL